MCRGCTEGPWTVQKIEEMPCGCHAVVYDQQPERPFWCAESWFVCNEHYEYGNIIHAVELDLKTHEKDSTMGKSPEEDGWIWDWDAIQETTKT